MKDFLGFENARNKKHAETFTRLLKLALVGQGDVAVFVGHHISFELGGDLSTENEVPSADCLMFDHDIMTKVFGSASLTIMALLASAPCEERDDILKHYLDSLSS